MKIFGCFPGNEFFGIDNGQSSNILDQRSVRYTMVFNAFAMMTLFDMINARTIEGRRNIFAGISKSWYNLAWIIAFILQVIYFN
jgi:Ca2+ transporting ATPase